jgi:PAS domain S-box-containing protein
MHQALWLAFALLLVLVTATLLVASYVGTRSLARRQADSLMTGVRHETEVRLDRIFDPIRQKVLEDYSAIRTGRYSIQDPVFLKDRLFPNLFSLPQVDSLMIGDLTGSQFLVMRYNSAVHASPLLAAVADKLPPPPTSPSLQFFTRDFRPATWGESSRWTLWDETGRTPLLNWELSLPNYDGRLRPWHKAAMAKFADLPLNEAHLVGAPLVAWTDVYPLFTTGKPGISASIAARDPAGKVLIVAYDLLLDEIAHFSTSAHPSPNGRLFVLTDDDRILGPPGDDRPAVAARSRATILHPLDASDYPEAATAITVWRTQHSHTPSQFSIRADGAAWWAGFSPFEIGGGKILWIGVLLPESDLVPAATEQQRTTLLIGLLALLIAFLLAGWLARRIATPLTALAGQARRIAELDLAPAPEIKSSVAELAGLSLTIAETRIALAQRIAERAETAAALQRSEVRYRNLIESALIGIVVHQDGIVRFANRSARQLFGYSNEDFTTTIPWDICVTPEDHAQLEARAAATLRGAPQPLHPGWQAIRRDGSRRWVQSSVATIEWDGQPAVLCFIRDITDLRAATERQASLEDQLRHAQKLEAIGLLAGGIAHDFNNLLQVIGGNAQLAEDPTLTDSERAESLREIAKTVQRAAQMTRQLLAFSRRQALAREETELNDFLAAHVKMIRRLIPENIHLDLQPSPAPVTVLADRGQLEQVLLNLSVNARDAMPHGGTLTLALESVVLDMLTATHLCRHPGERLARLTISDTGQGMDQATLNRIFEPFFTTKPRDKGTGLGLAVVYGIVRQHEGHIEVFSQPGQGARFVIHLPYLKPGDTPAVHSPAQTAAVPAARGGTILLAEDNEPIRRFAIAALSRAGYTVETVEDGQAALERFQRTPAAFDLLFFDVMMPRLGGFEAARRCRAIRPGIPAAFASGYAADSPSEGETIPEGTQVLQKPYRTEDLLALVARLLAQPRTGTQ